jgi:hypothetical protein
MDWKSGVGSVERLPKYIGSPDFCLGYIIFVLRYFDWIYEGIALIILHFLLRLRLTILHCDYDGL